MQTFELLEKEIGRWADYPPENVVACSSGTAALHLALEALDLPKDSNVLIPDYTMIACARAVSLAGLTPILVDCDDSLLMDLALVRNAITEIGSTVRVVMPVHIYGRCCNMRLLRFAKTCGITVVEDLAEAHGAAPHEQTDAACWSFYKNKIVAGEEGGAVAFRNVEHAKRARCLRSLGFTDKHDFLHMPRGHNYRMSNLHAGPILKSLSEIDLNIKKRRFHEGELDRVCPDEWKMPERQAPWVYDFRVPGLGKEGQDEIVRRLKEREIQARHGFKPMHLQEEYSGCYYVMEYSISERVQHEIMYVPLDSSTLGREREIFDLVREVVGKAGNLGGNPANSIQA